MSGEELLSPEKATPTTPASSTAAINQPSPYELERLRNIERNKLLLAGLGITKKLIAHDTPEPAEATPVKRQYKKKMEFTPTREYSLRNSPAAQKLKKQEKKEKQGSNIFDGMLICLVGRIKKPQVAISQFKLMELIRKHGGSPRTGTQALFQQPITHMVTTEEKTDEMGREAIQQLKEKGVAIVNENFLFDSIKRRRLQSYKRYPVLKEDVEQLKVEEEAKERKKKVVEEEQASLDRSQRSRKAPSIYGFDKRRQVFDSESEEENTRPKRTKKRPLSMQDDSFEFETSTPNGSRKSKRAKTNSPPKSSAEMRYDHIYSQLDTEQQRQMYDIWRRLATLTDDQGRLYSTLFMDLPSKKLYPDYYVLIKEPICLKQIEGKIIDGVYMDPIELEADVTMLCSNAQTYNLEGSIVYEDSKKLMEEYENARSEEDSDTEMLTSVTTDERSQ